MNIALPLMALGPAGGAILILAGGGGERARRAMGLAGIGAGIGATIYVLIHVLGGEVAAARGLETDAWRTGLALGALVVAAAGIRRRSGDTVVPYLAAAAAAVGSMIVTDVFTLAGFLVAATAATILASAPDGTASMVRVAGWLALADVLAVGALLAAAGDGMRVPPELSGLSAGLMLASAGIRVGALPWLGSHIDAVEGGSAGGALVLGPARAQGLLLAGWVATSGGGGARAMAIGGAVAAALWARRAARDVSGGASSAAVASLALAGLGLGGVSAVWGAVLLAAGMFVGATLLMLGAGAIGAGSVAAAPLGATLPGAALVASAALARGVSDVADLAVGIPAALALVWLLAAGMVGARGPAERAHPVWLVIPGLAALAIAVVPARALRAIAVPAAHQLGAGRPLTDLPGAMPDDLGILFAVAAFGGLLAATRPRPALPAADRGVVVRAEQRRIPRLMLAGLGLATGGVLALLWVGIRRGFI